MAMSAQPQASTISPIVPISLRVRMFMFAMLRIRLYGPRHSAKQSDMAVSAAHNTRAVQIWLYAVAALIFATLIVGGATRLTESGLSITEWKPVTGVLPPMSEVGWQSEFGRYQQIPQYREL